MFLAAWQCRPFCCCCLASLVLISPAQANADSAFNLTDVVVSASRSERPLADTPVRTQMLDEATIRRLHSTDLRDALRILPGVQLREIHGKTGEEVYLQGFNGDRVLILVDGMPVSATTGSTVDTSQLATLDIASIEVLPGAASALYGSAAMGGVINIITRRQDADGAPLSGRLSVKGGSYGERQLSQYGDADADLHVTGSIRARHGVTEMRLGVDHRQSSGYDLDSDTWSSDGYAGRKANLSAMLGQRYTDLDWQLNAERFREDSETRRLTNGGFKGVKQDDLQRDRVAFQGQWRSALGTWNISAVQEEQRDDTDQLNIDAKLLAGNLLRHSDYQQQKAALQWQSLLGGDGSELTLGLEWFGEELQQRKREIKLTDSGEAAEAVITPLPGGLFQVDVTEVDAVERDSLEFFSQLILPLGVNAEVSPGFRWQHDSDFGGYFAPSLAARQHGAWQGLNIQWRQSLGVGYRVPNLKNRYYLFDHSVNGYKVLGNPDLQPEKSNSVQLSFSLTDEQFFHAEIALFYNRIRDLIETIDSGERDGTVMIYEYSNYANAATYGADITLQMQLLRQLQQRLSFSYLDARDLDRDVPLINRAEHLLKGQWFWDISQRIQVALTGEYQGRLIASVDDNNEQFFSPDFSRWDIKADYRLGKNFSLYGGINNVTNTVRDNRDPYDRRPVYGRMPYIGFDWNF